MRRTAIVVDPDRFGVFLEIGWRGHQVWRNDVRYGANQAGIHIGGAIAL